MQVLLLLLHHGTKFNSQRGYLCWKVTISLKIVFGNAHFVGFGGKNVGEVSVDVRFVMLKRRALEELLCERNCQFILWLRCTDIFFYLLGAVMDKNEDLRG